jgi:pyridoxine 5-phosphate synthase
MTDTSTSPGTGTESRRTAPRLSVNVDHVATLRQARKAAYPDPLEAARVAEAAGASGITVHLRADRRHVQDADVARLRRAIAGKLNLEMATDDEMVSVAEKVRPHQVSLVPERPDEVTTEGGLDLTVHAARVEAAAMRLTAAEVAVSVFLDPEPAQVEALAALGHRGAETGARITGFEINTDAYTHAEGEARAHELARIRTAATLGAERGLKVYAGHGLTTENVAPIAAVPEIEELNIGHWLVARAVIVGMDRAVREMLAAMRAGAESRGS